MPDAGLTLLVVPEGIPLRALRDSAGEYFTGGPGGLVFVSTDRRRNKLTTRRGSQSDSGDKVSQTREQQSVGRR